MKFLKAIFVLKIFAFLPFAVSAQNFYGGIPALFDDFSYTNTEFPIAGDSSGSLYGKNIWLTGNGAISSRAWHRYNFGDEIRFGKNSSVDTHEDGISLKVLKGFNFKDIQPVITSGFLFRHGTFVSRVRFSSLSPKTFSIQAFWLFSPDHYRFKSGNDSITYMNEVDFEWNNWFMGRGKKRVNASIIWAFHSKNGGLSTIKEMNFFKKDRSGDFEKLPINGNAKEYYTENKWFYYLIRLDSNRQTSEFLAESGEESPSAEKIYGGQEIVNRELIPVTHYGNFPRTDLLTMYNSGMWAGDNDSILHEDGSLDVDWFYYSPRTDLLIRDVVKEVSNFKKQDIHRVNTTGRPTFHDSTAHLGPPSVIIDGPDEIIPLQHSTWIVRPSLKNTLYDVEYDYRRLSLNGASDWYSLDVPEGVTYARPADTAIEWRATVKDWRGMTASTFKNVKVHFFKNKVLTDIFPNPTSGLAAITLPESFEKKEFTVRIFTAQGKKVTEYSSTETQYATIELSAQPAGQYIVIISNGVESFQSAVTVVR